jgi:hypothetical protein
MIGNIVPAQANASLAPYPAAERNAQAAPKTASAIEDSVQISKAATTSASISEIIKGAADGDVADLAKLTLIG